MGRIRGRIATRRTLPGNTGGRRGGDECPAIALRVGHIG